jgi:hypothetical protein
MHFFNVVSDHDIYAEHHLIFFMAHWQAGVC